MEIKVETLSAVNAREIVERTDLNGYGHRERIACYKQWMLEGKWALFYNGTGYKFINDPLIFLPGGRLFEGKHRIIALSELGDDMAVDFWVLRDFTQEEAFQRFLEDTAAGRLPKPWTTNALPPDPRQQAS